MSQAVALYARVSTKDKGQDTENQLAQLRAYTEKRGWTIFREYIDQASGKSSDRDQFTEMFTDARKRRFDIVLFWSLDRLSREGVSQTLAHLQKLDSYGVGWKSFTEEYLDSCGIFKDAVIAILATIAKQERIRLSERVKAGIQRYKDKRGKWGRQRLDLPHVMPSGSIRAVAAQLGVSRETVRRRRHGESVV